jgi:hypothetical protein
MHVRAFLTVSTGTTGESTFPIAIRIATAFGKDERAEPTIVWALISSVETFHRLNTSVGKKFSTHDPPTTRVGIWLACFQIGPSIFSP